MKYPVILLLALATLFSACSGTKPLDIGVKDGQFRDCPSSPNCVSTQTTSKKHKMNPIPYTQSLEEAKAKLLQVIADIPRTTVTENKDNYIHSEFKSKLMKYVDDVEFYFDDKQKVIHFRSASRKGYSDLGVNRKRMTAVTEAFGKN